MQARLTPRQMVQSEFRLADLSHQPAIVSPRATMTRFERAEQLGEMLTADDGIDHVVDTYLYEYPKMAGSTFGMPYIEMVEGILSAEYC